VIARVDKEANRLRALRADKSDELGSEIAVQHCLDNQNASFADYKARGRSDVILGEYVVRHYSKHAGRHLFRDEVYRRSIPRRRRLVLVFPCHCMISFETLFLPST